MKIRIFIGLSLVLNLALAVVVFQRLKSAPSLPLPPQDPPVAAIAIVPSVAVQVTGTNLPPRPPSFNWSQIAAADLKTFRDNLRAVGCPELTVHEIIRAEVNELFGARRHGALDAMQNQFWQVAVRGELSRRQMIGRTDWGAQLEALATERRQLLVQLLGPEKSNASGDATTSDPERDWLSAAKHEPLQLLEQAHEQRLLALSQQEDKAAASLESTSLQEDFEKQRRELLTSEELEELMLRESSAANWPENVPGFEPTETEWRAVARLQLAFDQAQQELSGTELAPEEQTKRSDDLTVKLKADIQAALGPERGAEYERETNPQ